MSDPTILTAAASVVAAAPSNVRNRLAAIARSTGTYRTVLLQMLQDAVGRSVADVEVVTGTGELTEVGEAATRLVERARRRDRRERPKRVRVAREHGPRRIRSRVAPLIWSTPQTERPS